MKHMLNLGGALVLLALFTNPAAAGIVYENAPFPTAGGSNFGDNAFADDFMVFGGDKTITGGGFWTLQSSDTAAPATGLYALYPDAGGVPGAYSAIASVPLVSTVVQPNAAFGLDLVRYEFDLAAPFEATAGTRYWFTVYLVNAANIYWAAGNSALDGDVGAVRGPRQLAGPWTSLDANYAFFLTDESGAIPAPAPLAILATGLVGLALSRRARR